MITHKMKSFVWIGCLFLLVSGCGRHPVPTEGTVFYDDKPLDAATIVFFPEDAGVAASGQEQGIGVTDEQGHFHLQTINKKGAFAGKYKVTVSKRVLPPGVKLTTPQQIQMMAHLMKEVVPLRYTSADQTPLKVEIPSGGNNQIEIRLDAK